MTGNLLVVRSHRVSRHESLSCCYVINILSRIYITLVFRQCAVCLHHSVPIKMAEDIVIKELLNKSLSVSRYTISKEQSIICGNKMPTGCSRGFYCRSYCLLNMYRGPLCPSSGAQEYYTVVAACGI